MRAHFTGVSASGMALDPLAHVPGCFVSLACMATLVLTPRVQGFDARTGCSLSLTGSALLSRPCQGEQNMATEGPTYRRGYGTGASTIRGNLRYQSADTALTVPLARLAQDESPGVLRGIFGKKFFVTDFVTALPTGADHPQNTYGAVPGSSRARWGRGGHGEGDRM